MDNESKYEYIIKKIVFIASTIGIIHMLCSFLRFSDSIFYYLITGLDYALMGILCIFIGLLLIACRYEKKSIKQIIKKYMSKEQMCLCALFVITCLSIAFSGKNSDEIILKRNLIYLYDLWVSAFVLFPLGRYYSKNKLSKKLVITIDCLLSFLALLMVWVLVVCIQCKSITFGTDGFIGMNASYQLNINCNSNFTGMYSATLALICILYAINGSKFRRVVYSIYFLVFYLILVLSNSRASYIGFSCSICIICALLFVNKMKNHQLTKYIGTVLTMVTVWVILAFTRQLLFNVYDSISGLSEELGKNQDEVMRQLEVSNLSGRGEIWINSVNAIFKDEHSIIIGSSPAGVIESINSKTSLFGRNDYYTHNQFLEMFVALGIPGGIMYILWLIFVAKGCVKIGFARINDMTIKDRMIPLIILCLVIINLVEARLVYHGYFVGSVFFAFSGWSTMTSDKQKE